MVAGTALGVGGAQRPASAATRSATLAFDQMGVSGSVAAQALNRLASQHPNRRAHAMTTVQFILNWLPNVEFAGLWVAQKYGWWQKAGIQIKYTPWSASVHPETDVPRDGGNTFGFQSGAAIAIAASQHVPIQALYTDTQKSVFGLTVLKKSHITRLTQLKGKKVGYQPHELYVPETMLASVGLKINRDWKPVPVGFDIVQLTQGNVDAYLTFVTNEPIALDMQGVPNYTFDAANYGFHFYDDVLFTYTGLIKNHPGLVRSVVANVAKGFQWAHTHPAQTARLTVNCCFHSLGTGENASQHLQQQVRESQAFVPFSRDSGGRFSGLMSTSYWRDSINTLFRYGEIHSKPNPATIYTNQFNPYR
ncbi:MAG: ABC transporter substrate-binding protein [Chloroflexi bacterium]|nr:ABC transporter substrate-binding protein [Chloroflexota bacterium]